MGYGAGKSGEARGWCWGDNKAKEAKEAKNTSGDRLAMLYLDAFRAGVQGRRDVVVVGMTTRSRVSRGSDP